VGSAPAPLAIEPLLGRKKELADVLRLVRVDGVRAITITGPPGVGKRRFAGAVVRELRLDEQVSLATAEEPRGLPGERVYRLRPLAEAPAVELFREHAETAAPGFDAPYAELARLCRRIGRLPLAIELAAARPRAALAELADRSWTLPAVVAWTCERLTARQREVLRAVAAGAAAADDDVAALAALNLVAGSGAAATVHAAIREAAATV
jgi:hypothetical protein